LIDGLHHHALWASIHNCYWVTKVGGGLQGVRPNCKYGKPT